MTDAVYAWPAAATLGPLVRAAQRGDAAALNRLLAILRPALVGFFRRQLRSDLSEDLGEDLAQVALVRIAKAVRRIDPERADSYTITVARNLLRDAYREHARDRDRYAPIGGHVVAALPRPDTQAEYEELVLAVDRAVRTKLSRPLRAIVRRVLADESQTHIADALHVTPVTVRTRLLRARWILRRELVAYVPRSGS